MTGRLKIKFLACIWGKRYIEEFGRVALPSYLSPGNLPAVAEHADLEVIIMTSRDSKERFLRDRQIARLRKLCTIRYVYIDDLITSGNYGVTLTLAFARGIQTVTENLEDTCFLFMNSDFILADGSLRTMVRKLEEGHRCILAPSLRASSETILPVLQEHVDKRSGTLTMAPRDMVRLTFDHLHPTVIAKTVTQDLTTCRTHNQVYWQVDNTALLGRYHLIFMLAIRPEKPLGPINSYCDYGFIPDMVPSGQFHILDDSDEFFMLELQAHAQEGELLRGGVSSPQEISRQLSSWTTQEHRRFGEIDVLFHTEDIPAHTASAKAELAAFMDTVKRKMSRKPLDYRDHYYWVLGLLAWASLKSAGTGGRVDFPPEVEKPYTSDEVAGAMKILRAEPIGRRLRTLPVHAYYFAVSRMRQRARTAPDLPIWDHLWLDYRLVRLWARTEKKRAPTGRRLIVCDAGSALGPYFASRYGFEIQNSADLLSAAEARGGEPPAPDGARYDTVFFHVYRANMRKTRDLIAAVEKLVDPEGRIAVFVEHVHSETDPSNFSAEFTHYLSDFLPANWRGYKTRALFVGGMTKRRLRLAERRIFEYFKPGNGARIISILKGLVAWPAVAAMTAVNNVIHRNASSRCPEYCSSFLISFDRSSR